jgi:hypothetical protein
LESIVAISRVGFDKVKTAGREHVPFELRIVNGLEATVAAEAVMHPRQAA